MTCLSPYDSFLDFDTKKLIRLAQFYPKEFSSLDLMILSYHDTWKKTSHNIMYTYEIFIITSYNNTII